MNALLRHLAVALLMICGVTAAHAAEFGTKEEAKAMAEKAAAYVDEVGAQEAFKVFSSKDPRFHDRDLYVLVFDDNGKCVAHGEKPALVGKTILHLKDVNGKELVKEIVSVQDEDWVTYKWQNPATKTVQDKATYVIRRGEYVVGVGAYTN